MDDLIDDGEANPGNTPEYSVSEISGAVKRTIESGFAHVRVRGEIGRVSRPRSGHVYLDLKDERSVLSGVIWKGQAARMATEPEEGLEVVATGRLTTFAGQSKYQIVIEHLAPAGIGALMAMLEKRRKALADEGLFDEARKRPLPYLPGVIGVVTSPSGAVIRDILHRLRDRFPVTVLVWPVAVQGQASAGEVAAAIRGFNALDPAGAVPRPDLLIVARGGGSIEDLWGFNEEIVVRAVVDSKIPLISAVGHETDTTLIDFAADRRAPTPTAAAELAVPVRSELLARLDGQAARLTGALARALRDRSQRLRDLARALPRPEDLTRTGAQRLDYLSDRLPRALSGRVDRGRLRLSGAAAALRPATLRAAARHDGGRLERNGGRLAALAAAAEQSRAARFSALAARLGPALHHAAAQRRHALHGLAGRLSLRPLRVRLRDAPARLQLVARRLEAAERATVRVKAERLAARGRLLETLSHQATLRRGFAVIRDGAGGLVPDRKQAAAAAALEIEFRDGRLSVAPSAPRPSARKSDAPAAAPSQRSLFDP